MVSPQEAQAQAILQQAQVCLTEIVKVPHYKYQLSVTVRFNAV